ncbi:DUF262 domain-containing protein [Nostoc sp. FACHB-87]|uniref:DUF262 domain-containing protein n=1 Tax=Nostocaceae TaxID=1162 RepID=UPI00168337E4|nr:MULTISPECIES: DUF262 domain-containing protein [Nostocaceae]MBD2453537.1 DUF262 domain-containing protein [Nostoc sp. FACHB-87]MBD2475662.1 DUF262 domain-containing protein [Anabaena sp. FACHB-83]
MENGQKTILELFDGRKIFNIPKYQRAYSWESRQLNDFINDVKNQSIDKEYFFGTILFQEKGREGNFEVIDIVDGQQRITTLIIFMKVLLDKLKKLGEDVAILEETYIQYRGEYKLRTLLHDNDLFKAHILEDSCSESVNVSTSSQKRLLNAKDFFKIQLEKYSLDVLEEFKIKIEKTRVLTYSVNNDAEATLIFETTNDRGKPLTSLEKIKSFLMYKIYLISDSPDTYLDVIQTRFSEIYRDYEAIEKYKYDEDSLMRYHFIAFEEWTTSKDRNEYDRHLWTVKNRINNLTVNHKNYTLGSEYIDKYSKELKETFFVFKSLIVDWHEPYLDDLFYLERLASFFPLLIKAYKLDASENKKQVRRVIKLLEIISFRVYGIRRRRNTTGQERLYKMAQTFSGDFEKLCNELKDLIGEYCSDREFIIKLQSSSFYEDVPSNEQNYLFWKYENYIRTREGSLAPKMRYRQYGRLSTEHIIPQNPRNMLTWMDNNFREQYLHSLGNLTLDTQIGNASKSNHDFAYKNARYYKTSPFKCQNELENFLNPNSGEWDINSIKERSNMIAKFALKYWDFRYI